MRKFALLFLVVVTSFGFVGCKKEHVYDPENDPNLIPKIISVSVSYVEYVPMQTPEDGEHPTGLTHTTVVFNWNVLRSEPIHLMGDQSRNLMVGMECSNLELVSSRPDGDKCFCSYRLMYQGLGYLVTFTLPASKK